MASEQPEQQAGTEQQRHVANQYAVPILVQLLSRPYSSRRALTLDAGLAWGISFW
jgi:hypothetical protein